MCVCVCVCVCVFACTGVGIICRKINSSIAAGAGVTDLVVLSSNVSACSGIPYTCSTPGNEISMATALGPEELKSHR